MKVRKVLANFGLYSKAPIDYKKLAEEVMKCVEITYVSSTTSKFCLDSQT